MRLRVTTPNLTDETIGNDAWAEEGRWQRWLWRRSRPWYRWAGVVGAANLYVCLGAWLPLWFAVTVRFLGWQRSYEEWIMIALALLFVCVAAVASALSLVRGLRAGAQNLEALVGVSFGGGSVAFSACVCALYFWRF